ncbi:conserved protein of unknown function [Rhodovastum atsumiense]|uniref:DUF3861 domain-containing protein n=1 Tax=Rhodovastum atsumiense TaxID=504468 RepID=A0A5M6IP30_9PROT|nr:DUF3861 domain-containing protein [Rhodovastum atsumiense]KAA5610020.1 DUF3861 domain-containing protein [Rhodovastum atsumiense]CAH2602995.1 conserved protein of unknown function [Rhodovastum atsumiense]
MSTRAYTYRITVTPTGTPRPEEAVRPPLSFEVSNHDDILAIVERSRRLTGLPPDTAAAMAVGLKLLGEVVLQEKVNPLFDPLRGALRSFIGGLKALGRERGQPTPGEGK